MIYKYQNWDEYMEHFPSLAPMLKKVEVHNSADQNMTYHNHYHRHSVLWSYRCYMIYKYQNWDEYMEHFPSLAPMLKKVEVHKSADQNMTYHNHYHRHFVLWSYRCYMIYKYQNWDEYMEFFPHLIPKRFE